MEKNIILITIDCLRADQLAVKGAKPEIAPYLNYLFNHGQCFANAFSNGPYTYSSFPSILTGTYALIHGGGEVLNPEIKTLAQFLSENGYLTVGINSNPYLSKDRNYGNGFDVFIEFPEWSSEDSDKKGGKIPYARGETVNKKAEEILSHKSKEKPLFLWIHYMDLHVPYVPPPEFLKKFLTDGLIERSRHLYGSGSLTKNFTVQDKETLLKIYNACLHYCDICIEDLFKNIIGQEIINNSLVIITSDHGESFYEHGRFGHFQDIYDELLSVPLLIMAPGLKGGINIDHCVSLIDVPTTIADFISVSPPDNWSGKSLLSYKNGSEIEEERVVYASFRINEKFVLAVRDKRWKLVFNEAKNSYVLYDVASDPLEREDVKLRYPKITAKLKNKMRSFLSFIRRNEKRPVEAVETEEVKAKLKALGYIS